MLDIGSLLRESKAFATKLSKIKKDNPIEGGWYGYDILSNLVHLDRLLSGENRSLFGRLGNKAVADIGCADGDLGFFLETLGYEIDFVDWPATNWNGLRGVRRLVELLNSGAQVHAVNLDEYFALPRPQYELVLFLGILYHLKNPFYVLERLAKSARYCFVSTRVFRVAPGGETLAGINVAYLLGADESENGDATNYWIMTEPCLRRLFHRTGWDVLDFMTVGEQLASNPQSIAKDQRAFALLRSRLAE
jgi:2-polyprenyl-3-methyl-5-hydroxy-6-metoxy-1,4-benzoquinol methylase